MVAPRAGAWIEMEKRWKQLRTERVAPRAGAWIEIPWKRTWKSKSRSRSPCGSVD